MKTERSKCDICKEPWTQLAIKNSQDDLIDNQTEDLINSIIDTNLVSILHESDRLRSYIRNMSNTLELTNSQL